MAIPILSFSSYTKGLHPVTAISSTDESVNLTIKLPPLFESKLAKRAHLGLMLDGVYAKVITKKTEGDSFEILAAITKTAFVNSTLPQLKCGESVSIGMFSCNPKKWLLAAHPRGTVKLTNTEIAKGHTHTREFTFECSRELFELIQKVEYIGLNGSGITIKEKFHPADHHYFTVHLGKNTLEKTAFGGTDLKLGTEFTLTLPFIE